MARFYTKKGDGGYTSLLGKGRARKYDHRIVTVGTIDEANASIALARTLCLNPHSKIILLSVQKDLYLLMSEIAAAPENAAQFRRITSDKVIWLETQIDEVGEKVHVPDEFIIPGDSKAGAAIDLARSIVRRAERETARLLHSKKIENTDLLRYLNRLSSLCFVLELLENQSAGKDHPTLAKE